MSQYIVPRTFVSRRRVGDSAWGSVTKRPNKTHYAVGKGRTTNPKFFILSVDNIPANLPGSYGLQIRNADGSVAVNSENHWRLSTMYTLFHFLFLIMCSIIMLWWILHYPLRFLVVMFTLLCGSPSSV